MELKDSIYPRLGLAVLHCGYFYIHMGQLYLKNMCVLKCINKVYFIIFKEKINFLIIKSQEEIINFRSHSFCGNNYRNRFFQLNFSSRI